MGPWGARRGTPPPCSAPFGSGDTAGLGADAGLPTALPQETPPSLVCAAGLGASKHFMGGGFWAPRGGSAGDSGMELPLGVGRG